MCRGVQRETEEEWTGPCILYMRRSWKSPWRGSRVAAAGFRGHEERVVGVVGEGGDAPMRRGGVAAW